MNTTTELGRIARYLAGRRGVDVDEVRRAADDPSSEVGLFLRGLQAATREVFAAEEAEAGPTLLPLAPPAAPARRRGFDVAAGLAVAASLLIAAGSWLALGSRLGRIESGLASRLAPPGPSRPSGRDAAESEQLRRIEESLKARADKPAAASASAATPDPALARLDAMRDDLAALSRRIDEAGPARIDPADPTIAGLRDSVEELRGSVSRIGKPEPADPRRPGARADSAAERDRAILNGLGALGNRMDMLERNLSMAVSSRGAFPGQAMPAIPAGFGGDPEALNREANQIAAALASGGGAAHERMAAVQRLAEIAPHSAAAQQHLGRLAGDAAQPEPIRNHAREAVQRHQATGQPPR